MQVGRFSCVYFAALCSCMVSGDSSVKLMNRLFDFPGWKALGELAIVLPDKSVLGVDSMLPANDNQGTVTAGNLHEKTTQAYHFFGCEHARVLTTYCNYEMAIAYQCLIMTTASDQDDCLKNLVQTADDGFQLIRLIETAMEQLRRLGSIEPENEIHQFTDILNGLNNDVFQLVLDEHKLKFNMLEINQTLLRKIVHRLATAVKDGLLPFFVKHCSPVSMVCAENAYKFDWADNFGCPVSERESGRKSAVSYIASNVRQKVNRLVTNIESMGFEYDVETVSRRTAPQARQTPADALDELLSHFGWIQPDSLCIVRNGDRYDREQVLSMNTDKKFNSKFRRVHQLFSCQMARFLIDYFVTHADIGNHCLRMKDARNVIQCQKLIMDTLKDVDVTAMLMRGALLHLYQLSPRTWLNKAVSDILDQFADDVEMAMLKRPRYELGHDTAVSPDLARDTTGIQAVSSPTKDRLVRYYQQSCWPVDYLETVTYVEDDATDARLVRLSTIVADGLRERTKKFLRFEYPSLGFLYDPFLNTASVRKRNNKRTVF